MFTKNQIDFMRNRGFDIDFNNKLSDDDYIKIEKKASHLLQTEGFDENYEPTQIGIICEEIIDAVDWQAVVSFIVECCNFFLKYLTLVWNLLMGLV